MLRILLLCSLLGCMGSAQTQNNQDPEFTKGFILVGLLNNGLTTGFKAYTPDLYTGGVALNPQFTVVQHVLRVGVNSELAYHSKRVTGIFGPMVALKLKTLDTKYMGSYANIQLIAVANWGTNQQQLAGGGLAIEVFKKIHLGLVAQRDYHLNNWWFRSFIGVNLAKSKEPE